VVVKVQFNQHLVDLEQLVYFHQHFTEGLLEVEQYHHQQELIDVVAVVAERAQQEPLEETVVEEMEVQEYTQTYLAHQ